MDCRAPNSEMQNRTLELFRFVQEDYYEGNAGSVVKNTSRPIEIADGVKPNEQDANDMTKIEAIIQNSKVEAVKSALQAVNVEGMTVSEVRGHGRQKGHTEVYRGREYSVDLIPKTKLEMVLPDALVDKAVEAILGAARTGKIGDGKIFLSRIDEAIRIRNDERGEGAL